MNKYRFERDKRQSPEDFRNADGHLYSFSGIEARVDEEGVDYTVLKYIRSNVPNDVEDFIHDFIANEPSGAIEGLREARRTNNETRLSKDVKRALTHRAIKLSIEVGSDNPFTQAVASLHEENANEIRSNTSQV